MASNINTTNIDTAYPVAGQDNDSQGFRDNFFNTNENFKEAKTEIEALQGTSAGNYVFDITQVPDNTMDNWVLTYDYNGGINSEIRLKALPVSDETAAGIIQLADQTEVNTGTDAVKAVTPLTLETKLVAGYEPIDATILKDVDIGVNVAAEAHVHEGTEIDATAITDGHVLTADGAGNSVWEAPAGGASDNWIIGNAGVNFTLGSYAVTGEALALGNQAAAMAANATAIGAGAYAGDTEAIAIHGNASGPESIAIGNGAETYGNYSVVVGAYANTGVASEVYGAVALGYGATCTGLYGIAIGGDQVVCDSDNGIAIGSVISSGAYSNYSSQLGFNLDATSTRQVVIGSYLSAYTTGIADVSGSVKLGVGNGAGAASTVDADTNFLYLHDSGKLETHGQKAMFIAPPHTIGAPGLPTGVAGGVIYVTDASPSPALCFYNGTSWIDIVTGIAVA